MIIAALHGRLELVIDVFGPGFRGVVGGSPEATLLHHAAWVGDPPLVLRLLERGADPLAVDGGDGSTALAWAARASMYWESPGRDHVAVAEALVAEGNVLEPAHLDIADGPLGAWIEEQLALP